MSAAVDMFTYLIIYKIRKVFQTGIPSFSRDWELAFWTDVFKDQLYWHVSPTYHFIVV